ncbi:MAG: hypothetical protein WCD79_06520 [Chthoniobacteraceae bacterium]
MKHRLCLIVALTTLAAPFTPLIHAEQDLPPVDVNGLINSLKAIQRQQSVQSKGDKLKLAQQFIAASRDINSAIALYEDAIRATKFAGESRESTQFQDWKKDEADKLKSKPFRDGLCLHLLYLGLTMERSAGIEVKDLLADLISFTQQVMVVQDTPAAPVFNPYNKPVKKQGGEAGPEDNEWLKQSLASSIFVKWQLLGDYVTAVENWELVPGNVDGIYSKTILPEFRRTKDVRVVQYWDMRIARESSQATSSGKNFDADRFNQIAMPDLLWSRAQELLALDQKNRAILDMVKNIKSYPTHPNVPQWIAQLQQILQPPAVAPAVIPNPAAAAPVTGEVPIQPAPGAATTTAPQPAAATIPPAPVGNPTPTQ